ncbi:Protein arginine N-methyltransferase CARM1 [Phaffia rhodozyma]|uniref:Protein arginine N-methyltransferase CARM1 n=1 Tax=Phaffia rhodozyma TaxID=264483 RepID=A0A0F7ST91_PHARH|nr:Protein arginine N-methyltransferase CARM1 [Phaffia rhodozyma]
MSMAEDQDMVPPDARPPSPDADSKPSQLNTVPVDDLHPFDLGSVVAQFKGRALISRLALIYASCPSLRSEAAALALPVIKAETFDVASFDSFGGDHDDLWRQEVDLAANSELEKLETELKSVQANLIKESVRMCNMDLGKLFIKVGDNQQALKHLIKTRDYNSTSAQNLEMCMRVIEIHIASGSYNQLLPYVVKAEAALERPVPSAPTSSVPLSAAQVSAKVEEAIRRKEERTRILTRLQIARALSSLGLGAYEKAAREFLAVKGDFEEWAHTVISPTEVAICGSLCALASLRRLALKSELLLNDDFRAYVDEEGYVRDLVDAFVDGKYKDCLSLLEKYSSRHRLTPFLSPHVSSLTASIRRRALVQYYQPFQSVKLSRMADAFGCSEDSLLTEATYLVDSGEIAAKIDLVEKILSTQKADPRSSLFRMTLKEGEACQAASRRAILRMKLVEEAAAAAALVEPSLNMPSAQDTKTPSKTETVDDPYFHYYASLQNQANMLSDTLRTTGYRKAILGNSVPAFQNKTVMDIGAGSGILSFFSVEAGAKHVYACEASDMASKLQLIVDQANRGEANIHLKDKITVNRGKVEARKGPKVDTLVSEPIGVLLLHERMVESYIYARDNFLKPGGAMFPSGGAIHLAPFTDDALYMETLTKASFFRQNMYGVDLSILSEPAMAEVFAQPVVGLFPPSQLTTSTTAIHDINFYDVSLKDLKEFRIPISWAIERTSLMHGIATWFDIQFAAPPSTTPNPTAELIWQASIWSPNELPGQQAQQPIYGPTVYPPPPANGVSTVLSTSPHAGKTHWQQCRLLLCVVPFIFTHVLLFYVSY